MIRAADGAVTGRGDRFRAPPPPRDKRFRRGLRRRARVLCRLVPDHGGGARRPAEGVLLAVLAVAAGHAAGRICGSLLPVAAPCAAALAGLGLLVAVPHFAPGPQPGAPLGHAGATAALLALATGAACCAAWSAGAAALRLALGALAAGIALTAAVVGSTTGLVACTAVLLASLAACRIRHRDRPSRAWR
ncbi:hypothetical protein SGLAM104S_09391 [Streptomyces glaucescens]